MCYSGHNEPFMLGLHARRSSTKCDLPRGKAGWFAIITKAVVSLWPQSTIRQA